MKTSILFKPEIPKSFIDNQSVFVRIVVGLVFLTEGIQKYLFPELLGTGRFAKLGFSDPAFWAYFTGTFEIICGTLIINETGFNPSVYNNAGCFCYYQMAHVDR